MGLKGLDESDEEETKRLEEQQNAEEEIEEIEDDKEESEYGEELISRKLAAIESHKRSRTLSIVCILGIAGIVVTTVFFSMTPYAGAASACIFSGVLAMLGVRAIKDYKRLESVYDLGKRK